MQKYGRVDANHNQIVEALRAIGASVVSLASLGGGVPDLLVGWNGCNFLMEVKTVSGRLTRDQKVFFAEWRGHCKLVRSPRDATQFLQEISMIRDKMAVPQPAPTRDGRSERVLDHALDKLDKLTNLIGTPENLKTLVRIQEALIARAEKGKEEYGDYLHTFNGRDARTDGMQELLDGLMYFVQEWLEAGRPVDHPAGRASARILTLLVYLTEVSIREESPTP